MLEDMWRIHREGKKRTKGYVSVISTIDAAAEAAGITSDSIFPKDKRETLVDFLTNTKSGTTVGVPEELDDAVKQEWNSGKAGIGGKFLSMLGLREEKLTLTAEELQEIIQQEFENVTKGK